MKKKTKKKQTPSASPKTKKEKKPPKDSIMGFYLKSFLLAFGFFLLLYYIIIYGYVDVRKASQVANRMRAKAQVSAEDRQLVLDVQPYQKSLNYKWFHNYKWVYHQLLQKNLDIMEKSDTFSLDQKRQYKNGVDFSYIKIIKDKTPEDAVILMPDAADLKMPENAPDGTPQFRLVAQKAWSLYFLYPRTLVYEDRDGLDSINGKVNIFKNPNYEELRKKVSHVAIIYGRGYEHLEYSATTREYYTALPIRQTEQ
jgi:hypothetical protein